MCEYKSKQKNTKSNMALEKKKARKALRHAGSLNVNSLLQK